MLELNDTHDPARRSWVPGANSPETDFPIQNLPLGVFDYQGVRRGGIAIGNHVLDLKTARQAGLFSGSVSDAAFSAAQPALNDLMALGQSASHALRMRVVDLLDDRASSEIRARVSAALLPSNVVRMQLPCVVGDYTDFLTSIHHTERHGKFKGLKDPLPPAFKSLPVAYHGRASSIRVSGTPLRRPYGQWREQDGNVVFGAVESLDFELEMAAYVARGNELGDSVSIDTAPEYIFGYSLLNDWSAKGIQWWEQVLGPFLGKSFMTSVSPWVITQEALAPFATHLPARSSGDPLPLPYLTPTEHSDGDSFSIGLTASIRTALMRKMGDAGEQISSTDLSCMYWSFRQMITHHTSNGCNLRAGDLLGSGTLSGESLRSMGCMTEMTYAGKVPISLQNGEQRMWLQDGDEIVFHAKARREDFVSIGFGTCEGCVQSG